MSLESKLAEYGLSQKEAKVYLSAMELGPSPVQKIAQKAGVNRVTAYSLIESLAKRALMSSYEQGKKTLFVASDPEKLLSLFEQKKREIDGLSTEFQRLLPELKSIYNVGGGKPMVRYYEGYEASMVMNEEMLQGKDELIEVIFNKDLLEKFIPTPVVSKFSELRSKRNLKVNAIYSNGKGDMPDSQNVTRYRISSDEHPILCDVTIYKNKVNFIGFEPKISGVIIEDKNIAETLRTLFYLAVQGLKK
jgi:sugar-specific transcriptional regulator TrmB